MAEFDGRPFTTLKAYHDEVYKKLRRDTRIFKDNRIDHWGQGRFNLNQLPQQGTHAKYERLHFEPGDRTLNHGPQEYTVMSNVWVLETIKDIDKQYDLIETHLGMVTHIMQDTVGDITLDAAAEQIDLMEANYAHDYDHRNFAFLIGFASFKTTLVIQYGT